MKKKILLAAVSAALMVALAACGTKEADTAQDKSENEISSADVHASGADEVNEPNKGEDPGTAGTEAEAGTGTATMAETSSPAPEDKTAPGAPEIDYNNTVEIFIDGIYGRYQHSDSSRSISIGIEYYTDGYGGPFRVTADGDSGFLDEEWLPLNENTIVVNTEGLVLVAAFYENGMDISVVEADDDTFYTLEGSYVLTESWNDVS